MDGCHGLFAYISGTRYYSRHYAQIYATRSGRVFDDQRALILCLMIGWRIPRDKWETICWMVDRYTHIGHRRPHGIRTMNTWPALSPTSIRGQNSQNTPSPSKVFLVFSVFLPRLTCSLSLIDSIPYSTKISTTILFHRHLHHTSPSTFELKTSQNVYPPITSAFGG